MGWSKFAEILREVGTPISRWIMLSLRYSCFVHIKIGFDAAVKVFGERQSNHLVLDIEFSDPDASISLPFPPLLDAFRPPSPRTTCEVFQFLWVDPSFQALWKRFRILISSATNMTYGASRTGKSHLLAALSYCLIWKGKEVVYTPNCNDLSIDSSECPCECLRRALLFTMTVIRAKHLTSQRAWPISSSLYEGSPNGRR